MDTDKLQRLQTAVELVHDNARRAALEAGGDRGRAYQLLNRWAGHDAVLQDALNSFGLLITLKEELESQGEVQRAISIGNLLAARDEGMEYLKKPRS